MFRIVPVKGFKSLHPQFARLKNTEKGETMKRRLKLNAIAASTPSPRHLRSGKILDGPKVTFATVSPFFEDEKSSEVASTLNSKKNKEKSSTSSEPETSNPTPAVETGKIPNLAAKKELNSKKKKNKNSPSSKSETLDSVPAGETAEVPSLVAKKEEVNPKKKKKEESSSSLKSEISNSTPAIEIAEIPNLAAKKEEINSKKKKEKGSSSSKSETPTPISGVEAEEISNLAAVKEEINSKKKKENSSPSLKPETLTPASGVEVEEIPSLTVEKEEIKRKRRKSPVKIEYEDAPEPKDKWMPAHWEILLDNIKEMRKNHTAPVDDMGCHKCADPDAAPKVSRFQNLLALMLSSQTKDQVTHAAMQKLIEHGCTPEKLSQTSDQELADLIYPVSFYKRKVEYIKKTIQILNEKYDGDIPNNIKELCQLPGVGPKMGHICMKTAWGEVSGIGVDTHVHRICNRLQWVKKATKTPEETRLELEGWLPKELWTDVNALLVGFGQEICLPRFPKCNECLNRDLCPFVRKGGNKKI